MARNRIIAIFALCAFSSVIAERENRLDIPCIIQGFAGLGEKLSEEFQSLTECVNATEAAAAVRQEIEKLQNMAEEIRDLGNNFLSCLPDLEECAKRFGEIREKVTEFVEALAGARDTFESLISDPNTQECVNRSLGDMQDYINEIIKCFQL